MVQAIIFDCFGVLATEAWLPFKSKYFGHDPTLLEKAGDISKQANAGLISREECMIQIAGLAGISPGEATNLISRNVPNEPLFEYLHELKADYKLGFLSNIAGNYLNNIFTPDQLALFDDIILSYETGHIKPEFKAFEDAAKRLGVELPESVLVDDLASNVTGARQAGMRAILYTDFESFKPELEKILAA